jgi:RHH-type proline utilization regulon transcriptional repressor/proline dehydrogenase/delta 1-pyrroline-5-carboxylate dehydrogenase
MAGDQRRFEFQRLHGMGEELYAEVVGPEKMNLPCRVYAPVGEHEDLLPYLVRRLLENGANTSFVNRIVDDKAPVEEIIADPVRTVSAYSRISHPRIPPPANIYGEERVNARGINLADSNDLAPLARAMEALATEEILARPVVGGRTGGGSERVLSVNPADTRQAVGEVIMATEADAQAAIRLAASAQPRWDATSAARRAEILGKAADLFEAHAGELMGLCVLEAGKTVPDCVSELREAVDFLRYYAAGARRDFSAPVRLPGPTGESNELSLHGRGVFVCISPWNFPLAIFTGQVAAALAAGNAVIAKPAEQTSLVAARATALLYEAGVPGDVLNFLPGYGAQIGGWLLPDPRVAGVAFTGSTETARVINRQLAERDGPIATLIAETGGQNALLVDSSALPEQVVMDIVRSSFNSAGQRCSALRVVFLQEDIADRTLELLSGYMDEMVVGNPGHLRTDLGPVIDSEALVTLEKHAESVGRNGTIVHRCTLSPECADGTFFAPVVVEIDRLDRLEREVFGPILHVVRYRARDLDRVIAQINATGYGLTLGVHTRIDGRAREIFRKTRVGNTYVNRNMVGAVVGVQPFGGQGLSGTGPKAGGPHYLHRFATEKTLTINTSAVGGNASLLALEEG